MFGVEQLLLLIPSLLIAACCAGLIAGLLGVGGGIVVVPVLLFLFQFWAVPPEVAMHFAVGTSLGLIIFTAFSSARSHWRKGNLVVPLLRSWGVGIAFGAVLSGLTLRFYSLETLKIIFAAVVFLAALNLLRKRPWVICAEPPLKLLTGAPIGFCIAYISGLMGIGGGTMSVPAMTACSVRAHKAVGTSAGFNMLIALFATVGMMLGGQGVESGLWGSVGFVNLPIIAVMFPVTMLVAPWGAALAQRLSERLLRGLFAAFLLLVSARMGLGLFG